MNRKIIGGLVLVILGAAGMAVRDIPYTTHEEMVNFVGVQITSETTKQVPIPLIAGAAVLVAGCTFIVIGARKP